MSIVDCLARFRNWPLYVLLSRLPVPFLDHLDHSKSSGMRGACYSHQCDIRGALKRSWNERRSRRRNVFVIEAFRTQALGTRYGSMESDGVVVANCSRFGIKLLLVQEGAHKSREHRASNYILQSN